MELVATIGTWGLCEVQVAGEGCFFLAIRYEE